jgi:hypothetical protein
VYCSVLYAVVATFCMAATRVCLHDVSLMYLCVESAHGVEGGAAGQHTWHTCCPYPINRYKRYVDDAIVMAQQIRKSRYDSV